MFIKQNGFSLPEITVALGLVAGISLVTIKMMENQANNENRIKYTAQILQATGQIKQALSDPENCRYMLAGKQIGEYATPSVFGPTDVLYARIKNHNLGTISRVELLRPNSKYQGFKTRNISLRYPQSGLRNVAEVVVSFRLETKSILFDDRDDSNDAYNIQQVIPVIVKQSGNVISDCGPAISEATSTAQEKFCLSLGALAEWNGTRCNFRDVKCGWGEVPEFQNSSGTINCVRLDTQIDPNMLFDTNPCNITSKNFSIESTGYNGKLKVRCL